MLKKVIVTNYLGKSAEYTFDGPTIEDESGLFITDIEGLGPVKATINMTQLATADGDIWNSSRLSGRNIVLKARFTYAKTIEEARLMSYKFFPIGKKVTFHIETDNRMAEVEGYVESNTPDIFTKNSSMQVSILCESPWFASVSKDGKQKTDFSNIEPMFEFVYENPGHDPVTEFGQIVVKRVSTVYHNGDVSVGCKISIFAFDDVEMLTIYNVRTREQMFLDTDKLEALTGHKIIKGDTIVINTVKGNKYINLIRDGVTTNVLNILGKDPDWFQLETGDNLFGFTAEVGDMSLMITVESQVLFEGV